MKSATILRTLFSVFVVLVACAPLAVAATADGSMNLAQCIAATRAELNELKGRLDLFPGTGAVQLSRRESRDLSLSERRSVIEQPNRLVIQLCAEYRVGRLRELSRTLKAFDGQARRLGQNIEQLCIATQRDQTRLFDVGVDNDEITFVNAQRARVDTIMAELNGFAETMALPEELPETGPVDGDDDDDDEGAASPNDGTVEAELASLADQGLLGQTVTDTVAIGQSVVETGGSADGDDDDDTTGDDDATGAGQTTAVQHGYAEYTVNRGDCLSEIAYRMSRALGVPYQSLMDTIATANYLPADRSLYEGQQLRIPVLEDANGRPLQGEAAEVALAQWEEQYRSGRAFSGADVQTEEYAGDVVTELRIELRRLYDNFYTLGSGFGQLAYASDEDKEELVAEVRQTAATNLEWARRRYVTLSAQIESMPQGEQRTLASQYLRRLGTVARCCDNLQYARATGWRFEYCNQQMADLLGAAGGV